MGVETTIIIKSETHNDSHKRVQSFTDITLEVVQLQKTKEEEFPCVPSVLPSAEITIDIGNEKEVLVQNNDVTEEVSISNEGDEEQQGSSIQQLQSEDRTDEVEVTTEEEYDAVILATNFNGYKEKEGLVHHKSSMSNHSGNNSATHSHRNSDEHHPCKVTFKLDNDEESNERDSEDASDDSEIESQATSFEFDGKRAKREPRDRSVSVSWADMALDPVDHKPHSLVQVHEVPYTESNIHRFLRKKKINLKSIGCFVVGGLILLFVVIVVIYTSQ